MHIFYGIILTQFEQGDYPTLKDFVTIHVTDPAEYLGLRGNLNKQDITHVIEKAQSYHNIVGVIHRTRNGNPTESYYQVLNFESYDDKNNLFTFSNPYMNYVIKTIYRLAVRKTKDGKLRLRKNDTTFKSQSFLFNQQPHSKRTKQGRGCERRNNSNTYRAGRQ